MTASTINRRSACCSELYPNKKDADGKAICSVCEKPLPAGSRRYCSNACRDRVYVATSPSWARAKVHERDKGICAECGCDTDKIARIFRYAMGRRNTMTWAGRREPEFQAIKNEMGFTSNHLWEMDHILPVSEGGGLCGLENLRTLCVPCHKKETAALADRRAYAKRKAAWTLPLVDQTEMRKLEADK